MQTIVLRILGAGQRDPLPGFDKDPCSHAVAASEPATVTAPQRQSEGVWTSPWRAAEPYTAKRFQQLLRSAFGTPPAPSSFLRLHRRGTSYGTAAAPPPRLLVRDQRRGLRPLFGLSTGVHSFVADPVTLLRSTLSTGCHAPQNPVESQQPKTRGKWRPFNPTFHQWKP